MRSSIAFAATVAVFAQSTLAVLFMTEPVGSTICTAGTPCNVRWNDDGNVPSLASIGVSEVGLYVGSVQQQVLLQTIAGPTNVSMQSVITYNPDPSVGPNGNNYFIRFTSLALKDATNAMYPYEAFSAKFTLNGMTGTFNSTISSLIAGGTTGLPSQTLPGASTTPASTPGAGTTTGSASGSVTPSTTLGMVSSTAKPSGSSSSGTAKPSSTSSSTGAATPNMSFAPMQFTGVSLFMAAVVAMAL